MYAIDGEIKEDDPLINMFLLDILMSFRHSIGINNGTSWNPLLIRFLNAILRWPKFLNWDHNDLSHLEKILQSKVFTVALILGQNETIKTAYSIFKRFINTNDYMPNPNLLTPILLSAIKYGTEKDWNDIWVRYTNTQIHSLKEQLLFSLTSTQNPILINRLLTYMLDQTKIKTQDIRTVISKISNGHDIGLPLVWDFIKIHWESLIHLVGDTQEEKETLLKPILKHISKKEEIKDFLKFYREHIKWEISLGFKQIIESLDVNTNWKKSNKKLINDWLTNQNNNTNIMNI
ncbi:unnamed protein product [Gordionus sp. m RMFG-2023]